MAFKSKRGSQISGRWAVEITGHEFDCLELVRLLAEQDPSVVVGQEGSYYLVGSILERGADPSEVQRFAGEIVELINGLAPTIWPDFEPVAVGSHVLDAASGRRSVAVAVGHSTARCRAHFVATVVGPDGQEKPDPGRGALGNLLEIGCIDPLVQRAVAFLSRRNCTWFDLYSVLEVLEEDLGQPASKAGICSRNQRSRFTRTANSYSILGVHARHGRTQALPPPNPMTFREARIFVLGLMKAWLAAKTASHQAPSVE